MLLLWGLDYHRLLPQCGLGASLAAAVGLGSFAAAAAMGSESSSAAVAADNGGHICSCIFAATVGASALLVTVVAWLHELLLLTWAAAGCKSVLPPPLLLLGTVTSLPLLSGSRQNSVAAAGTAGASAFDALGAVAGSSSRSEQC